jgi:hypothetical protein
MGFLGRKGQKKIRWGNNTNRMNRFAPGTSEEFVVRHLLASNHFEARRAIRRVLMSRDFRYRENGLILCRDKTAPKMSHPELGQQ